METTQNSPNEPGVQTYPDATRMLIGFGDGSLEEHSLPIGVFYHRHRGQTDRDDFVSGCLLGL